MTVDAQEALMWCEGCELEFDPIRTHWLCPHCGYKAHCCEGSPDAG